MPDPQLDLPSFAQHIYDEVERLSEAGFTEDHFTKYVIDVLAECDQIDDGTICHYPKGGMKVNGYHFNDVEDCLDLFVCKYFGRLSADGEVNSIAKSEVETAFRKARKFFEASLDGLYKKIEETSEEFNLAQQISQQSKKIHKVRFFLFTDGVTRLDTLPADSFKHANKVTYSYSFRVFDLEEIARCKQSGSQLPPIEIDFRSEYGETIPCLPVVDCGPDFQACVAMISGSLLCRIYEDHGSRLLERNVRSYLQAKGQINRKIKDTIVQTPERFLAYNNGISCTAEAIDFEPGRKDGKEWRIRWLKNFQIVNGGQTTASLYNAYKRYKADLSKVYVQAKISIVAPELFDETVEKIARYANSQNKISDSDFYALDPFHASIEQFSKQIWAPPSASTSKLTHWFYERARGAYADERSRSKRGTFDETNPPAQVFTKTELAKFENVWNQMPYAASLGDQKNFRVFTLRVGAEKIEVDEQYFKNAVAKAIVYRFAERAVKAAKLPAYKAQTVNHAIAYIVNKRGSSIDLSEIWKRQALPPWLEKAVEQSLVPIHEYLKSSAGSLNVTEWCKKEPCWLGLKELEIKLD